MSNTEVAIGVDPTTGDVVVHGLPSYVMVRPDLLDVLPVLADLATFLPGEDPKAPVTYGDFAHVLGGGVVCAAHHHAEASHRPTQLARRPGQADERTLLDLLDGVNGRLGRQSGASAFLAVV